MKNPQLSSDVFFPLFENKQQELYCHILSLNPDYLDRLKVLLVQEDKFELPQDINIDDIFTFLRLKDGARIWAKEIYQQNKDEKLSLLYKEAENLKNKFIEANYDLVGNFRNYYYDKNKYYSVYDDLSQQGYFGLLRAVEKFDYTRDGKFFSYAGNHIRNSFGVYMQYRRAKIKLNNEDVTWGYKTFVVHQKNDLEDNYESKEYFTDEDLQDTLIEKKELKLKLNSALDSLSPLEKTILELRFGFKNYEEKSLEEIGKEIGVIRETVRANQNRALKKIHEQLSPIIEESFHTIKNYSVQDYDNARRPFLAHYSNFKNVALEEVVQPGLYKYMGEMLTASEVARRVGIPVNSMWRWLKRHDGDVMKAISGWSANNRGKRAKKS